MRENMPTIRRFLPDNVPNIATRGYLLLPSLRIIECSADALIVFSPQNLLYNPPAAPLPDKSIIIVAVVSERVGWLALLFMQHFRAQPKNLP